MDMPSLSGIASYKHAVWMPFFLYIYQWEIAQMVLIVSNFLVIM